MNTNTTTDTPGLFVSLLTGWGLPGAIARIIVGAICGALGALCYQNTTTNTTTPAAPTAAQEAPANL